MINLFLLRAVPISLGWEHKDEINLEIKTIDGMVGLFLYKGKKEK